MSIHIRMEQVADHKVVYVINQMAFGQSDEADLIERLRKSDAFITELSLVAVLDRQLVGHILFTELQIINNQNDVFKSLGLAPMAVLPDVQNQGVGTALVRAGLAKAASLRYKSVIVLGHPDYYPRFGFLPALHWGIFPPFEVPENVFMGLELIKDGLSGVSGMVHYAKEFELAD